MRFLSLFRRNEQTTAADAVPRRILEHEEIPGLIYAIGDIHGCFDKLMKLEERIRADAGGLGADAMIIVLGDIVDRGPHSKQVIDHLMAPPEDGLQRLVLAGNHEAKMVEFLDRPAWNHVWLQFGGMETLGSYGIDAGAWMAKRLKRKMISAELAARFPAEHTRFLRERPFVLRFGTLVFVHAGIDRARPLVDQAERDLLWRRPDPYEDGPEKEGGLVVVHGHTPGLEVFVSPRRINLDTGAYAGGPLSAARFVAGRFDSLLASR